MLSLPKKSRVKSSRYQIQIKGVRDGVLELPNREYRVILEVSSINFELMSRDEQDMVILSFMQLLTSINFPIQILQRARQLDLDEYITNYKKRLDVEEDEIYRDQINGYVDFVTELVKTNKILTRQFLLVIPLQAKDKDTFEMVKERLANRITIIESRLDAMGVAHQMLSSLEILDLFGSFYNPEMLKRQPITDKTMEMLFNNYV